MSKTKISEFSTTPGNNTDINGINIAEGCAPSGINNAIRELMSDLKEWQSGAMDVYVIPQGTAAAPGIQLYGDLDTGLYGFAANQLGVAVGGASAGYFSSDGWVGNVVATTVDLTNIEVTNIKAKDGTSSIALADSTGVATFSKPTVMSVDSASDALRITQIGAGNALLVEDSANPDTSPFVVTAAGLVGVGTLNPTRTIHVSAASGLPGITLESTSNGSSSSGVVVFNRTTTSTLTSQTIGSALWSHNLTDSTLVTAASIIVTGNNTAGSNTANMAIDAKTSTIMKVNGTEVANFASGGLNVTGTVDVTSIETTNIKAKDGTAAASIADSTGVMTIASSVLTTTDINGGTIDGAVIGGSSAAAGTFTTITGTQVNSDNLRLDGNTLSSTDTNGNITIAPNGTGQVVMSGDLDVANIETGAIKARDGTAGATIANSTGQFTFSANIKRGVLELGQPTGITIAMIKATNTNGSIILQANGTGSIFNYADETVLVPSGATAKLITDNGINFEIEGSQETGTFTVGGTAQTGTQTIGRSTKTHTLNLGTGATESGLTKTINLGTGGVATSTTAITIGSTNGTSTTLNGTVTAATFNSTTIDTTNLEVTNIKAKDGTAALSIADSTGVVSVSANPVLSGGTANGVVYLDASKVATSGTALVFDGTNLGVGTASPSGRLHVANTGTAGTTADNLAVYFSSTNRNANVYILAKNTEGSNLNFGDGDNSSVGRISYDHASNYMAFDTSSSEKLRITSGGQVNIGGNFTSTNNTLQVTGNAAIGYTTAAPTTGLIVAGNVGVGTDAPNFRLHVAGPIGATSNFSANQTATAGFDYQSATNNSRFFSWGPVGTVGGFTWFQGSGGNAATNTMTLDSSGNLGIGTNLPGERLVVSNAAGSVAAQILASTTGTSNLYFADGTTGADNYTGFIQYNHSTNAMIFGTNGGNERARITSGGSLELKRASNSAQNSVVFNTTVQDALTLDSSGNLGLGVTPSAWLTWKAMQVGSRAAFVGNSTASFVANNFYYDGADGRYIASATAALYEQSAGTHKFFTAASGTAGNIISFTQALTLDANRNLLLNGTSAGASAVGTFAIFNGTAPTGSVTNGVILYAEDVSASSELKVRDEAGNVTTLSPHNFSLIPEGPSEEMAWSYYSERDNKRINIDMLKAIRLLEKLSGEKLVYES